MKLFEAGTLGYSGFRIPSLYATASGRLIALCEARVASLSDTGEIHIIQRVSDDGGETWSAPRVIARDEGNTVGNPCLVEHGPSGRLHLVYNGNLGSARESEILKGTAPARTVLRMESRDGGDTWEGPWDISGMARRPGWTWYACGPCHGLCLPGGRLVIPCNHGELSPPAGAVSPYVGHFLLSDDGGTTWRIGGLVGPDTNEATAACLPDGRVYINLRSMRGRHCRQAAWSADGGETVSPAIEDAALVESCCQGSVITDGDRLFFLNAADPEVRHRLTLKESRDGGQTWQVSRVVWPGPSAYGDMAILNGRLYLLFEAGEASPYERLELLSYPLSGV